MLAQQLDLFESNTPWVAAGVVLGVGLVVAVAVAVLVNLISRRLLADHREAGRVAGGTFWVVVAASVIVALGRLAGPRTTQQGLTEATTRFLQRLPELLVALLVVVLGWVLAVAVRSLLRRLLQRFQPAASEVLAPVAFWGVLVLAVIVAADQVGIEVRFVQALLLLLVGGLVAAAALALGLGTRDLVAAVVAGRHVARIVAVGDEVEVAGHRGRVAALGHASVRLTTDNGHVEVPNERFLDGVVVVRQRVGS